ncbi:MAG: hypothetical protein DLM53_07865 [Candidatus Eremiobacter antarcticus]|nr:MAG: hypothetical protein DLM53_07865 [Candidatus Eremiobacter sp. RRmetagenome_bin22]
MVQRFAEYETAYRSSHYNEAQVRREFIDPMFEALGWDMSNAGDASEIDKDVVHEHTFHLGSSMLAPDYLFRAAGQPQFYVEAKKPAVNIIRSASPAFQVRRYAWSENLPLSILTDFKEFAVYDCRIAPNREDPASKARLRLWTFQQYERSWNEIAALFSKDAVYSGSIDEFIKSVRPLRGSLPVDAAFLLLIERWREDLATNIAHQNQGLDSESLNYLVQMTIDRIVFLRIAEDRGLEPYGQLSEASKGDVYPGLCTLFEMADEKYNSGLFHFKKEANRPAQDDISLGISVDSGLLRKIIRGLYYPESPYEFSRIPIEILGQVYEQFLGKTITLGQSGQISINDKPEVRRAGGVYYTPTYIVDYIVSRTLEPLVRRKTPKAASMLRVVDPACGSGTFLIRAYQFLLDWHLRKYLKAPNVYRNRSGNVMDFNNGGAQEDPSKQHLRGG